MTELADGRVDLHLVVLPLPLAGEDDVARLAKIATTTRARKAMRGGVGDHREPLPPHVLVFLGRAWVRWLRREDARHVNLFVTNVPGPREPLWFAGARVLGAAVPIAPLVAGVPLRVASPPLYRWRPDRVSVRQRPRRCATGHMPAERAQHVRASRSRTSTCGGVSARG